MISVGIRSTHRRSQHLLVHATSSQLSSASSPAAWRVPFRCWWGFTVFSTPWESHQRPLAQPLHPSRSSLEFGQNYVLSLCDLCTASGVWLATQRLRPFHIASPIVNTLMPSYKLWTRHSRALKNKVWKPRAQLGLPLCSVGAANFKLVALCFV